MMYNMYAIKDLKAGYMLPGAQMSDVHAMRDFRMLVQKDDGIIGTYPEDFALYRIGTYDSDIGALIAEDPICLMKGSEVIDV